MTARAALAPLLLVALAAAGGPPLRSKKIDAAVAKLQPAVVKVYGVKGFRGVFGYMTGVIVHESGLVITRNSVTLEEAPQIRCHLHDGRRLLAQIVREDRRSKMVLLKLIGADKDEKYPAAKLGKSAGVGPGQFVMLLGNAYKVAQGAEKCAVNVGLVSAVTALDLRAGLSGTFRYDGPVILHDAMNNPGVYGGPLCNLDGEVIGVSDMIVENRATNVQVHLAIPIDALKPFLEDTLRRPDAPRLYDPGGGENVEEKLVAGYHGIRILRAGINRATPAYVDRVVPGSPAARAGVRPDDLILKIDQARVKSWKSFGRLMSTYHAGDKLQLTLKRGSDVKIVALVLEAPPR